MDLKTVKNLCSTVKRALDDHQVCSMRRDSTLAAFIGTRIAVVSAVLALVKELGGDAAFAEAKKAFGVEGA